MVKQLSLWTAALLSGTVENTYFPLKVRALYTLTPIRHLVEATLEAGVSSPCHFLGSYRWWPHCGHSLRWPLPIDIAAIA